MDTNRLIFKKIPCYTNQKYYQIYRGLLINEIKTLYKAKSLYGLYEDITNKINSTKSKHNPCFYFTSILSAAKQKTQFQLTDDLNETKSYTITILELKYLLHKIRKEIIPKIISLKKQYNISITVSYVKHLKFSKYIIKHKNEEGFIEEDIPVLFDEKDEVNNKSNKSSNIFVGKFDISKFMHNEQTIKLKKNGTTSTFVFMNNTTKPLEKKNKTKSKEKVKSIKKFRSGEISYNDNEKIVPVSNFNSLRFFQLQKERLNRSVDKNMNKNISININNMFIKDSNQRRFFLNRKLSNNSKTELKNNIFNSYLSNIPVSCSQTIRPSTEKNNTSQHFVIRRNMSSMNSTNIVSRKNSDSLVNRTLSTLNFSKHNSSTTVNRYFQPLNYSNSFINNSNFYSNTNISNNSGYKNSFIISRNSCKNQVYKQYYSLEKFANFSSSKNLTNLSNAAPVVRNKVKRDKKSNSSVKIMNFISKNDLYY